jgi:hypothetical protein
MESTLTYSISATLRTDAATFSVTPVSVVIAMSSTFEANRITVTEDASMAIPLGAVTGPTVAYFSNVDDTNFITIYDDDVFLAKIPAGQTVLLNLAGTETLKAQADTADCDMDYLLSKPA